MFIVLWVVMGVVLGGCAGLLLIAGLKLSLEARASDALSHVHRFGGGGRYLPGFRSGGRARISSIG